MKIDPRILSSTELQSDAVSNTKNTAARPAAPTAQSNGAQGVDTVQLSQTHADVQRLSQQIATVPEVRTSRVQELQAKVQSKQYTPDTGKIADALIQEQSQKSAKA